MVGQFNDLYQIRFGIDAGQDQAAFFQLFPISIVEFVAVPMPFENFLLPVNPARQRPFAEFTGVGAETHGSAFAFDRFLSLHDVV